MPGPATPRPRVAVVGAGAVGAFYAAHLVDAETAEVTLCVRTPFDELEVTSPAWGTTLRSRPVVLSDPAKVNGPVDWVLFATKAHQSKGAAAWLSALVGPSSVVVVLQNGVEHVERTRPLVGPATTVLPAVVYCGVEATAPGRVVHRASGHILVPAGEDADRLAGLFRPERRLVRPVDDIVSATWAKLCANVVTNGVTALTGRRMDVTRDPVVRDLIVAIVGEAVAVARAEGAVMSDSYATDLLERIGVWPVAAGTSMLYDRLAGRTMEEDALYGAVVRAGRRHRLATPVHDTMLALLSAISATSGPAAAGPAALG